MNQINSTNRRTSNYDYSKLIAAQKEEHQYESFYTFIRDRIQYYRENYSYGEKFTRADIAAEIGIETSTLTKIINSKQATRKRDLIIAICFALKMDENDTNLALNLYPMAPLNKCNLRDLVIIQAIYDKLTIMELNEVLETHGFPKLNVLRDKTGKSERSFYYSIKSKEYDEINVRIKPYDIAENDSESSLHLRYCPDRFDYHSEMELLKENEEKTRYLIIFELGKYRISRYEREKYKLLYSNHSIDKWDGIEECKEPDLLNEVTKLKEYTDKKARYVYDMCNDTRNYGSRYEAKKINGKLVIFGESFGFDAPELCEYYQLEVSSEGMMFSVSNSSRFLRKYLGDERWKKLYGKKPSPIINSFSDIEKIADDRWKSQFRNLLIGAKELLNKLQNKELFLFNARAFIDIVDLMHEYKVEEAFGCIPPYYYNGFPCDTFPQKDQIVGPDGKIITIDDLYRAAEMDIISLEELCEIRTEYGSLEGFLHIDLLENHNCLCENR